MIIEIVNARDDPGLRTWVAGVYDLYLNEIAEYDEGGRNWLLWTSLEPDPLAFWLNDSTTLPFVLISGDRPIGFLFVGGPGFPYMSPEVEYRVGEIFILREFRRSGAAKQAVFKIWDQFPGCWEVTELLNNAPAISFWAEIIGEYTDNQYLDEVFFGGRRQCFSIPKGDGLVKK